MKDTFDALMNDAQARYSSIHNMPRAEKYELLGVYWRDRMERCHDLEPITETRYADKVKDDLVDLMLLLSTKANPMVDAELSRIKNQIVSGLLAGAVGYLADMIEDEFHPTCPRPDYDTAAKAKYQEEHA